MLRQLTTCWDLLTRRERWYWAATIPLAVGAAVLEAAGAASVYFLIRLIGDPSVIEQTPVLRSLTGWLPANNRMMVLSLTLGVAVLYGLKNMTLAVLLWLSSRVAGVSWASLSQRMLRGYLAAPIAFHLRHNSADLIHNTVEAADTTYRFVVGPAVSILAEVLVISGLVVVLLSTAPGITVVAVVSLFALLGLVVRSTRQVLTRWGAQEHQWRAAVLRILSQALEGIKEVKLRGREEFIAESFTQVQRRMIATRHRFATLSGVARLFVETAFILGLLIVVMAVTLSSVSTAEVIPVLGVYAYAGFRVIPSVNRILFYVTQVRYGLPGVSRLHADMVACQEYLGQSTSAVEEPLTFLHSLELENVAFTYEDSERSVLDEINLSIRQGESIGIVGTTGAGKSTLINLILGLLVPTRGRILADGTDIHAALRGWQQRIGYVPQVVYLIDDSLRRNIAFAIPDAEIDPTRLQAAVHRAQLDDLVSSLPDGLETVIGERGIRLSGGERQRVAIARALYHEPDLLVFDEATSSLDPRTEQELTRAIDALHGDKTMLLVAHRLTTVQRCDRIVFLHGGRIAAVGSFDELLRDNAQFRILAATSDTEGEPLGVRV